MLRYTCSIIKCKRVGFRTSTDYCSAKSIEARLLETKRRATPTTRARRSRGRSSTRRCQSTRASPAVASTSVRTGSSCPLAAETVDTRSRDAPPSRVRWAAWRSVRRRPRRVQSCRCRSGTPERAASTATIGAHAGSRWPPIAMTSASRVTIVPLLQQLCECHVGDVICEAGEMKRDEANEKRLLNFCPLR